MRYRMFYTAVCLVVGLMTWPAMAETTPQSSTSDQYLMAVADYFEVSYEDVFSYVGILPSDEIPVAFYLAERSKTPVDSVVNLKKSGLSWYETATHLGLNSANLYVIVTGNFTSNTFSPIFEKFASTPSQNWRNLELTNSEIVNLVNLRVMYSQYDYSAYEVMAFRDTDQSWAVVNKLVAEAKSEYLKEEMAKKD